MNFEERVERIVDAKFTEQLSLLQDTSDRTSDLLDRLNDIHRILPLIRDIKTEVDQLQKRLNSEPKEDDDDDQQDESPDNNKDLDPNKLKEFDDFLKQLEDSINDLEKAKRLKLPDVSKMPRIDWTRFIWYLYNVSKDLNRLIRESWDEAGNIRFQTQTSAKLEQIKELLTTTAGDLSDKGDQILSNLEACCDSMSDHLAACCENMDIKMLNLQDTADAIKRSIENLDPEAMPNKDLALQSKTRAILAEVQAIRGLL